MTVEPTVLLVNAVAFALGVVAVGRITRLITQDRWPPLVWLRLRWITFCAHRGWDTDDNDWSLLATCPWCVPPYLTVVDTVWYVTGWHDAWWVANAIAAGAYLASAFVVRDEPE